MEKIFYSESHLNNYTRARKFERDGKWNEAKELHRMMGNKEDVAAIDLIMKSTELGDRFRYLVKLEGLNELLEDHKITIYEYTNRINKIHKSVYENYNGIRNIQ